jgi:hypothetical protein
MSGYYTHISDLLKHERLAHPVPPPEPVNDKKRMVAVLPYTKMPDTDEITFQTGDIFFVHNDLGDGWLWVTAHRTGEQGLVFKVPFIPDQMFFVLEMAAVVVRIHGIRCQVRSIFRCHRKKKSIDQEVFFVPEKQFKLHP